MTNRIESAFASMRSEGTRSVIPFILGGYPSLDATISLLPELARAGARVIEIGIPFSDPIADGPIISEAMRAALDRGMTPAGIFKAIAPIRSTIDAAIVFMVSVSIVERIGRRAFVDAARGAGADGLIIPDLDLDEAPDMAALCRAKGVSLSMLVAPATGPERMRRIVACSSGFVYLLARQGVTGTESGAAQEQSTSDALGRRVAELRSSSALPIACGFGIATAAQVATVTEHADAAIVGSALVRAMGESSPVATATALMRELMRGLPTAHARARP